MFKKKKKYYNLFRKKKCINWKNLATGECSKSVEMGRCRVTWKACGME